MRKILSVITLIIVALVKIIITIPRALLSWLVDLTYLLRCKRTPSGAYNDYQKVFGLLIALITCFLMGSLLLALAHVIVDVVNPDKIIYTSGKPIDKLIDKFITLFIYYMWYRDSILTNKLVIRGLTSKEADRAFLDYMYDVTKRAQQNCTISLDMVKGVLNLVEKHARHSVDKEMLSLLMDFTSKLERIEVERDQINKDILRLKP